MKSACDPEKVSFEKFLDAFWTQIDPTDSEGQFADKGFQYKTAVFYHDEEQKRVAEISKKHLDDARKFKKPVATEIRPYKNFYPAEEYHQNYANKKPQEYEVYKTYSGRKAFIDKVWGTADKV
jgi:methionine-S-sulfoxide reductase